MLSGGRQARRPSQRRVWYLVLAVAAIAVGLTVHLGGSVVPPAARDVLGDALWAVMMVCWMGVLAPRLPLRTRALAALAVCVAVELSQRYQTPALDALRRTVPGHLVLGSGYDPRDFVAYALGVALAALLARRLVE